MGGVTNKDLMDAINNMNDKVDKVRLELKGDIGAVDSKVNRVITAQAVDKTKLSALIAGVSVVVSAIVSVTVESIKGRVV